MYRISVWLGCWWRRIKNVDRAAVGLFGTILALLAIAVTMAVLQSSPGTPQNGNPGPVHAQPVHPVTPQPVPPSQGGSGGPTHVTPSPAPNPPPVSPPSGHHHHGHPGMSGCGVGHGMHHPHRVIVVKSGDTLWSLSDSTPAHGLKWEHLARVNHLKTPYTIYAGQVLRS